MTVVLGYVPSAPGFAALDVAVQEASWRDSTLVVVNVEIGGDGSAITFADEQQLDAVAQRLTSAGIPHEIRQIVNSTDVAAEILNVAEELSAELIVVGLHRRSSVGKMLLGSNAQRIIISASCPVLSVRPYED
jgi:nucleotide-binding universal stress UspA family protein